MAFNVELARKVRDLIAQEPRKLRMEVWGSSVEHSEEQCIDVPNPPPCGTVACLAGWIIFTERPQLVQEIKSANETLDRYLYHKDHADVEEVAADLLGVPVHECPFYETDWGHKEVLAWLDRNIAEAQGI